MTTTMKAPDVLAPVAWGNPPLTDDDVRTIGAIRPARAWRLTDEGRTLVHDLATGGRITVCRYGRAQGGAVVYLLTCWRTPSELGGWAVLPLDRIADAVAVALAPKPSAGDRLVTLSAADIPERVRHDLRIRAQIVVFNATVRRGEWERARQEMRDLWQLTRVIGEQIEGGEA